MTFPTTPSKMFDSGFFNRFLSKTNEQDITPKSVCSAPLVVAHLGVSHEQTLRGRTIKFPPRTEVVSIIARRTSGDQGTDDIIHVAFGIERPDLFIPNPGIAPFGVQNSFYIQFPGAPPPPGATVPANPIYVWKFKIDTSKVYLETSHPLIPFWSNFDIFVCNFEIDLGMQVYPR